MLSDVFTLSDGSQHVMVDGEFCAAQEKGRRYDTFAKNSEAALAGIWKMIEAHNRKAPVVVAEVKRENLYKLLASIATFQSLKLMTKRGNKHFDVYTRRGSEFVGKGLLKCVFQSATIDDFEIMVSRKMILRVLAEFWQAESYLFTFTDQKDPFSVRVEDDGDSAIMLCMPLVDLQSADEVEKRLRGDGFIYDFKRDAV